MIQELVDFVANRLKPLGHLPGQLSIPTLNLSGIHAAPEGAAVPAPSNDGGGVGTRVIRDNLGAVEFNSSAAGSAQDLGSSFHGVVW